MYAVYFAKWFYIVSVLYLCFHKCNSYKTSHPQSQHCVKRCHGWAICGYLIYLLLIHRQRWCHKLRNECRICPKQLYNLIKLLIVWQIIKSWYNIPQTISDLLYILSGIYNICISWFKNCRIVIECFLYIREAVVQRTKHGLCLNKCIFYIIYRSCEIRWHAVIKCIFKCIYCRLGTWHIRFYRLLKNL